MLRQLFLFSISIWSGVILSAGFVLAQVTTATISGTIKDTTGAMLPGATVTIKNLNTGITRTLIADDQGRYYAPNLALGNYEVQASLAGFQTEVRSGITLTIGREAVVDFTLRVGEITEKVVVTGEAPLVQTTTSQLASLVDEKTIRDLPLNGRDINQLALIQPGVVWITAAGGDTGSPTRGGGKVMSISGTRPSQSSFLLDGIDIKNSTGRVVGGAAGVLLGAEAIQEFTVVTNTYGAEFGRAAGGVINAVTKSGTNEFHGSAFEFHRNSALDAKNFFDKPDEPIPPFKRNQFGFSLGGPIKKDKTFFFGAYEGLRETLGITFIGFVPTIEARQGNLPSGRVTVDPAIRPVIDLFPLPNGREVGGGIAEYINARVRPTREDFFTIKIDHAFSSSDSFFARYTFDDSERFTPEGGFEPFGLNLGFRNQYVTIEEKKIISQNLLSTFRFGLNRSNYFYFEPADIPALRFVPPPHNVGSITIAGCCAIGGGVNRPGFIPINVFTFSEDISYVMGRHGLKFGALIQRYQENILREFRANGQFVFTSLQEFLQNRASRYQGGIPEALDSYHAYRQSLFGFYFHDDLRVASNFTLNLGLRYEFITNPTDKTNRMTVIINPYTDSTGTVVERLFAKNPSLNNLAPRIGFAWDLSRKGKTSLRGGFGIFFDQILPFLYDPQQWNPPFFIVADVRNVRYPNPFAGGAIRVTPSPYGINHFNESTAYTIQYNLNLQQEIAPNTVLTVGFVGNRGVHLPGNRDVNSAIPTILPDGSKFHPPGSRRRNPNFGRTSVIEWTRNSVYNSLQLSITRRLYQGLQFQASYIFSRTIDNGSNVVSADFEGVGSFLPQDPDNLKGHRGLTPFHIKHNLVVNYRYDLPIGPKRKHWSNLAGVAGRLIEGWQINGIVTLSSGSPFTINLGSFDRSRAGVQEDRPNLKPGRSNNPVLGGPDRYFDPTAFELQPAGFFGTLGRGTLIGPGLVNFDFALVKSTAISESKSLQFRAEFFNIFNRPNFGRPDLTVFTMTGEFNPNVGRITRTVTTSRQLQFGLKLIF